MSDKQQPPSKLNMEGMIQKIFQYQQRRKYWDLLKFGIFLLLFSGIGIGLFRQINSTVRNITHSNQADDKVINKKHIGLITLRGSIHGSFDAGILSTSEKLTISLKQAFSNPNTTAIVIRINSPGGAAVQSTKIFDNINYFRQKYPNIPIYAVCDEVCASAAYHIASACNEIYAYPNSMIGSLGTLFSGMGFGYEKALNKLGIERRLMTSGDKKGMLDPYSPLKQEDVKMLKEMQEESHQIFITDIKKGRGNRLINLSQNASELFSGRIWIGTQAIRLGLIDQLGGIDHILNKHQVYELVDYTYYGHWLSQLRKVTGMGWSAPTIQAEALKGLREPLMGLAYALQGLTDPLIGLMH